MGFPLFSAIYKTLVAIFAVLLILVGIVLTPTPIPIGIVLIGLGFMLLVNVSPGGIRWLRRRWRWFDKRLHDLERLLPESMAKSIRRSDYEHEDEKDTDKTVENQSFTARLKASKRH